MIEWENPHHEKTPKYLYVLNSDLTLLCISSILMLLLLFNKLLTSVPSVDLLVTFLFAMTNKPDKSNRNKFILTYDDPNGYSRFCWESWKQLVTLHQQLGSKEWLILMLSSHTSFFAFYVVRIPDHRRIMLIFKISLTSYLKIPWKHAHRNAQRYVSKIILWFIY